MDNSYNVKSENQIENEFMSKLKSLGYKQRFDINDIPKVEQNLKMHLERINNKELNNTLLTNEEFKINVINRIIHNSIFENAVLFRDLIIISRTKNENIRLKCFDKENFDNNVFEFSHQIQQDSRLGNRGDVTLFLNGFPIVQIELKRPGIELGEALNQIIRYKQEAFDNNIFKIIQLFIISNEHITKYFSNNNNIDSLKNYCFSWSDDKNKEISNLIEFTEIFLSEKSLFKMLTNYMVLKTVDKEIITLRPYQLYAIESIVKHIDNTHILNNEIEDFENRSKQLNGYIWHATGSGKTLTSFKTAQLLSLKKEIHKVVFLVDRNDLNNQTLLEFKGYLGENADDLDETQNSKMLEKQLIDVNTKIIVTTMQKLHRLLKNDNSKFINNYQNLLNKNFVFIIDECHRTQFGDMHKLLRKAFVRSRLIGFTGTPIFVINAKNNAMTTSEIFGINLHKYMMVNAINDRNVLKFIIEYIKGPQSKLEPGKDIEVFGIDKKEFFSSDLYHEKIADYIFEINFNKTKNNNFKSMLVCSNINSAVKYYWLFRKKYPDFKVAAIFSKIDNNTLISNDIDDQEVESARSKLETIIQDYNQVYKTNYSEKDFKMYSANVQSSIKEFRQGIDMVIVVRMLTTGFDAKPINTIYLDTKLEDHHIIQTISRANRVYKASKDYANVVSFQTKKKDVDEAVSMYSDNNSTEFFFVKDTLDELIEKINKEIKILKSKWETPDDALTEQSEMNIKEFINHMKIINKLLLFAKNFIEYDNKLIDLSPSELENYRSVQQHISKKVKEQLVPKSSILDDIDFCLDVFATDEINVDYILGLLDNVNLMSNEVVFKVEINKIIERIKKSGLKSKAQLLEQFIKSWTEKMLSEEYHEWKDKSSKFAYEDFRIKNVENKIIEFAKEYDLEVHKLVEVIYKKRLQNKPINSYNDQIRNVINNKDLSYLPRKELVDKIKEFITNINSDYYEELIKKEINNSIKN